MVRELLDETKRKVPSYYASMLEQRLGKYGSSFNVSFEELEKALMEADWQEVKHPAVSEGCRCFKAALPFSGIVGILDIDDVEGDQFKLIDPKGTGFLGLAYKPFSAIDLFKVKTIATTNEVYLISGVDEGSEIVFTFHPGEPVPPSSFEVGKYKDGDLLTKAEAISLGFKKVKVEW